MGAGSSTGAAARERSGAKGTIIKPTTIPKQVSGVHHMDYGDGTATSEQLHGREHSGKHDTGKIHRNHSSGHHHKTSSPKDDSKSKNAKPSPKNSPPQKAKDDTLTKARADFARVPKNGEMDSALLSAVPFEWLNEYGVGIPTVDGQHKKLFDMLMELKKLNVEELQNGGNSSSLALMECLSVIGGLMDYTQYHFSTEELLMKSAGYDIFDSHIALHRTFITQISKSYMVLEHGDTSTVGELCTFLTDWLINHIKGNDKQFGRWLAAKQSAAKEANNKKPNATTVAPSVSPAVAEV